MIHKIKDGIKAKPNQWTGVTPGGHVITTEPNGNYEDHGPIQNLASNGVERIPQWVWAVLGVVAIIGTIVLFATGVGELGTILVGASAAVRAAVLGAATVAGVA